MEASSYKRVLIKLSGEQLSGKFDFGIDAEICGWLAAEIRKAVDNGTQVVIVAGGGNLFRGQDVAKHGISRVTGEHMGMLGGVINAIALNDVLNANQLPAICLSNIFADQIAENYSYRKAINLLADGKTLVVAGGIGRPYFTHDTAAVNLALELDCQVVLKATKVNGVYNRDPVKFPDAQMIPRLSFKQAVEDSSIAVMDKSALGLAMDHSLPIIVFDAMQSDAILKISRGEDVGTRIDV